MATKRPDAWRRTMNVHVSNKNATASTAWVFRANPEWKWTNGQVIKDLNDVVGNFFSLSLRQNWFHLECQCSLRSEPTTATSTECSFNTEFRFLNRIGQLVLGLIKSHLFLHACYDGTKATAGERCMLLDSIGERLWNCLYFSIWISSLICLVVHCDKEEKREYIWIYSYR